MFLLIAVISLIIVNVSSNRLIEQGELKVTLEHPFYVDGEWIRAGDLEIGDELVTSNGGKAVISSADRIIIDEPIDVYNLHVDGPENYYANDVLVHNKNHYTEGFLKSKMYPGTGVIKDGNLRFDEAAKRSLIEEIQRTKGVGDVGLGCDEVDLYRVYWRLKFEPEVKQALLNGDVIYPKGLSRKAFELKLAELYKGGVIPRQDFANLVHTQAIKSGQAKLAISTTPSKGKALDLYERAIQTHGEALIVKIPNVKISDIEVGSGGLLHDLEFTIVGKKSALGIEGGFGYELIGPEVLR